MIDFHALSKALDGLQTPRLTFRAARAVDGWALFDATRNRFFNRYLTWSQPSEPYEAVARMEAIAAAHRHGEMTAMSMLERDTGKWVGLFRFVQYRHDPDIAEIGLWIHSDFFHASYGYEIGSSAVDAGFSETQVPQMLGASYATNRGVQAIMAKCGFSYHSTVPRPHEDGKTVELMEFRLTRAQWEIAKSLDAQQVQPAARTRLVSRARDRQVFLQPGAALPSALGE